MAGAAAVARRAGRHRHRRRAARDPPGRAGDRHRREGAEGGEGGRRAGRAGGAQAAGVGAGGDDDRVRARVGGRRRSRCPPPKPVPAVQPAGQGRRPRRRTAGRRAAAGRHRPAAAARRRRRPRATAWAARPLTARPARCQPPVPPTGRRPEDDPAFTQVTGERQGLREGEAGAPAGGVEGEGGPGRRAGADRRPRRPGQGGQGRHDGRPAAGRVRQEGVHRGGEGGDRGEVAEDAQGGRRLQGVRQGRRGQGRGQGPGHARARRGRPRTSRRPPTAPPDQSKAVPKPVTPMGAGAARDSRCAIPAAGAVPKPAPAEQTQPRGRQARRPTRRWPTGEVTEQQLAQSNEPQFQQALADKQAAAAHADTAPARVPPAGAAGHRAGQGRGRRAETTAGVAGMHGAKGAALAKLVADKGKTKSKDEAKRAEVTAKIQGIFAATEADVKKILDGIDPKVEAAFEQGRGDGARAAFEAYVAAKMSAYKEDRYSGWLGGLRWAKDKLLGMPDKVNEFYEAGRELYLKQMDGVISQGRRHRRRRPDRGEEADRRRARPRSPPTSRACPPTCRRSAPRRRRRSATGSRSSRATSTPSRSGRRHPRHQVRRGPQGPRRADRGAAGGEQGPGRQGHRRDQGRHQHDPRARRDAHERARPGRPAWSATSSSTRSGSSAT